MLFPYREIARDDVSSEMHECGTLKRIYFETTRPCGLCGRKLTTCRLLIFDSRNLYAAADLLDCAIVRSLEHLNSNHNSRQTF